MVILKLSMSKSYNQKFNHLKIHTQYSICEGAIKIDNLKDFCKKRKIQSIGLSDTSNLCGALEFAENISKVGTQPIIGTQINFRLEDTIGLIPLIALNEDGYKRIVELSSKSYLENKDNEIPHCSLQDLLNVKKGMTVLSGSLYSLLGNLFSKNLLNELDEVLKLLKEAFSEKFYMQKIIGTRSLGMKNPRRKPY